MLAEQGEVEEGIRQIEKGLAAWRATGEAELWWPYFLALLAEAHGKIRQAEEGLTTLAEALALVDKNEERHWEAELYRLSGELLRQWAVGSEQKGNRKLRLRSVFVRPSRLSGVSRRSR